MDAEEWESERKRRRDPSSPDGRRWSEGIEAMRASRAARRSPLSPAGAAVGRAATGKGAASFRGIAWSLAQKIVARARDVGQPDEALAGMEARMREWVEVVIRHKRDERELLGNEAIPIADRLSLMRQMRDTLREIRIEQFGE